MACYMMHMQRALDTIEAIGGESMRFEDLRHIGLTHLYGITLRGTFEFPIARYAHRFLPSTSRLPEQVPSIGVVGARCGIEPPYDEQGQADGRHG
jgi:hypothetical protein